MQNNQLNYLSTVLRFRDVVGGLNILRALHAQSEKEWDRSKGADTNEHLIKGVQHSMLKTEAVRTYVSKLARLYLDSWGAQPSCWTKKTLMSEDTITKGVIDRITNMEIHSNDQLFTLVVTRVLGVDLSVVQAVTSGEDHIASATAVINYLGWMNDELDVPAFVYSEMVILVAMLMKHQLLNDTLFSALVSSGNDYFLANPECDLDPIDLMDAQLDDVARRTPGFEAAQEEALARIQASMPTTLQ